MSDLIKTLSTGSPLQEPFHQALETASLDQLREALQAKGIKAANRKAIEARIPIKEMREIEARHIEQAQRIEQAGIFQPSNGTEGDSFMSAFCFRCGQWGAKGCDIQARTMAFGPEDPEYPREWTYDGQGDPTCTAFVAAVAGQPVRIFAPKGDGFDAFVADWCGSCSRYRGDRCPIYRAAAACEASDPEYPREWRYDGNRPVCTAHEPAQDGQGAEPAPGTSEPKPPPEPAPAAPQGLPTPEQLVRETLHAIRNNIQALTDLGWTQGDIANALADMMPGGGKVEALRRIDRLDSGERFPASVLLGELIAAATKQLRLAMVPWNATPEDQQKDVLGRVRQDCEKAARSALRTYASENRTNFMASVDGVAFKSNGIKVSLTVGKNEYAHLLADRAGDEVLIVLPENFDMYSGTGSAMRTDPDQRELFGAEA